MSESNPIYHEMREAFRNNDTTAIQGLWDDAKRDFMDAILPVLQSDDLPLELEDLGTVLIRVLNKFNNIERFRRGELTAERIENIRVWCPKAVVHERHDKDPGFADDEDDANLIRLL